MYKFFINCPHHRNVTPWWLWHWWQYLLYIPCIYNNANNMLMCSVTVGLINAYYRHCVLWTSCNVPLRISESVRLLAPHPKDLSSLFTYLFSTVPGLPQCQLLKLHCCLLYFQQTSDNGNHLLHLIWKLQWIREPDALYYSNFVKVWSLC